jgi:hypothetical protein
MKKRYHSFLLRIWESGVPENPIWRISLENTMTREMIGFDSVEEMIEFLCSTLNATQDTSLSDNKSFDK